MKPMTQEQGVGEAVRKARKDAFWDREYSRAADRAAVKAEKREGEK